MSVTFPEFDRDTLLRLPLPLAQLLRCAHNAPEARARHNNAFFLFEAAIKLAASVLVAGYAHDLELGEPHNTSLDEPLSKLQKPSLGHWVGILRELSRHFGRRADGPSHPLGHIAGQLDEPRRDRGALLNLYRRIKNGPDAKPSGDQSCSLLALFDALTTYRNTVMGHGADRCDAFYEQELGPLLLPAAADILAEGVLDFLGPPGSRLAYLGEVRKLDDGRFEVGVRELLGAGSMRVEPLMLNAVQIQRISPNRLAVLWRGHPLPLRLDPLLVYREATLNEEVRFLNSDRGKQVEYLSYMSGETERDPTTVADLERLLKLVAGHVPRLEPEEAISAAPPAERDFEILAEVGRGGMGVIYLARQISLGRLVALKMLPAELSGDEVALARFNREIRALGQCDDPHIVKVLTSGKFPDGHRYYAMEYVPGADLDTVWQELAGKDRNSNASDLGSTTWSQAVLSACRLKRTETLERASAVTSSGRAALTLRAPAPGQSANPQLSATTSATHSPEAGALLSHLMSLPELPTAPEAAENYARRVAMLIRDAARALQSVHNQGIIHRDVKPANLMLTPDGTRVVLMDFGLAKGQTVSLTASRAGGLLGTLRYAAPEQLAAASLRIGPAVDVRGLGVTMWELLTRRRLFGEAEDERQLAALVHDQDVPRLRVVDPSLDADLEAIVARATERRVADRIQSASQLADYLQLYLDGASLPIRPPSAAELLRRWVREHAAIVRVGGAAALAVVIAVVTAFALINSAKEDALNLAKEKSQLAAANLELAHKEADARTTIQQQATSLARGLFELGYAELSHGDSGKGLVILESAYEATPASDPLRDSIRRFISSGLESAPIRLPHGGGVHAVAYSPDGVSVLTGSFDGTARLWDARTGRTLGQPMKHDSVVWSVAYSPDGATVSTATGGGSFAYGGTGMARLWDAHSGAPRGEPMKHNHNLPIQTIAFSPDGNTLLTGGDDLTARFWDARTSKPLPLPPLSHDGEIYSVMFGPDGKTALTGSSDGTARLWDARTGKPLVEPMKNDISVHTVAYSPDGTKVVTGGQYGARLWDSRSGTLVGTPMSAGFVRAAVFGPDGATVLTGGGEGLIYDVANLWDTRTGTRRGADMRHADEISSVAYSPDGTTLLTGSHDKTARLWDAPPECRFASP